MLLIESGAVMDSWWWYILAFAIVLVCAGLQNYALERDIRKCTAMFLLIWFASLLGILLNSLFIHVDVLWICFLLNIALTAFAFIRHLYAVRRNKKHTEEMPNAGDRFCEDGENRN
jgi:FtsH-binding integral membrane protein